MQHPHIHILPPAVKLPSSSELRIAEHHMFSSTEYTSGEMYKVLISITTACSSLGQIETLLATGLGGPKIYCGFYWHVSSLQSSQKFGSLCHVLRTVG